MDGIMNIYNGLTALGSMSEELQESLSQSIADLDAASLSVENASASVDAAAASVNEAAAKAELLIENVNELLPEFMRYIKGMWFLAGAQFVVILIMLVVVLQLYRKIGAAGKKTL